MIGAGKQALQLAEGHQAAGDRERTKHHLEAERPDLDRTERPEVCRFRPVLGRQNDGHEVIVGNADQRRGQRPQACEMAVRWGMAVIGIQIEIAAPMPSQAPDR